MNKGDGKSIESFTENDALELLKKAEEEWKKIISYCGEDCIDYSNSRIFEDVVACIAMFELIREEYPQLIDERDKESE